MTAAGERWSPWGAVGQLDHVEVIRAILPDQVGGVCARLGDRVVIVLDQRLSQAERRVTLAHELVHLERDSIDCCFWAQADGAWTGLQVREEMAVNREVARRLVPGLRLGRLVKKEVGLGHQVTAPLVAERFNVTEAVARLALEEYVVRSNRRVA